MHQDEQRMGKTGRKRFLRQLGVTLIAAVGAGALAEAAFANPGQCCPDCSRCGTCAGGTGCYCYCDCTGISSSYCWNLDNPGCRTNSTCVSCPC